MIKVYCDRCGKELPEFGRNYDKRLYIEIFFERITENFLELRDVKKPIHLCPDCNYKVYDFIYK